MLFIKTNIIFAMNMINRNFTDRSLWLHKYACYIPHHLAFVISEQKISCRFDKMFL